MRGPGRRAWLGLALVALGAVLLGAMPPAAPNADALADSWATRAPMPTARQHLGVAAAGNGKLYAIGGFNGAYVATVEEYDPATNTWTTKTPMPTARSQFGVATAANG